MPEPRLYDLHGVARVSIQWIDFERLLDSAFEQIRMYSKSDADLLKSCENKINTLSRQYPNFFEVEVFPKKKRPSGDCPKCGELQQPGRECLNEKCKTDIHKVRSPLHGLRFRDLRHQAITELSEGQASDETIMAIAGHVDRRMMSHYSHIRRRPCRAAVDRLCGDTAAEDTAI
jgi:hypothetical protein